MSKVIGLVGELCAGKGTFAKLLQERLPDHTFHTEGFSTVLRIMVNELGAREDRENLQRLAQCFVSEVCFSDGVLRNIGNESACHKALVAMCLKIDNEQVQKLRNVLETEEMYGPGALADIIERRISAVEADVVVLDGVRWPEDEQLIRRFNDSVLVYVTADLDIRHKRVQKRSQNHGESEKSLEEFRLSELEENEKYIPIIGMRADCIIENNDEDENLPVLRKAAAEFIGEHFAA